MLSVYIHYELSSVLSIEEELLYNSAQSFTAWSLILRYQLQYEYICETIDAIYNTVLLGICC